MIFEEKNIVELSLDKNWGKDTIVYPIGDDENIAYAFMAIIYFVLNESLSLIYVGITEFDEVNETTPVDIRHKFFRTELQGVQALTENQKLGLEPISENVFSTEDPVGAYNRFQDLIFEYEQEKNDEKGEENFALVAKLSEKFENIYL